MLDRLYCTQDNFESRALYLNFKIGGRIRFYRNKIVISNPCGNFPEDLLYKDLGTKDISYLTDWLLSQIRILKPMNKLKKHTKSLLMFEGCLKLLMNGTMNKNNEAQNQLTMILA